MSVVCVRTLVDFRMTQDHTMNVRGADADSKAPVEVVWGHMEAAQILDGCLGMDLPVDELAEFQPSGDGSYESPLSAFWSYSSQVDAFQQDLYDLGFVYRFEWGEGQDEAERLAVTPGALDGADLVAPMKMLTVHIRKERFSGGHLPTLSSKAGS